MKFLCKCSYVFIDQSDDLPFKGRIYPDQSMESLFTAIDAIFDSKRPKAILESDRMMDPIVFPKGGRTIYQCPECGRIYIEENSGNLSCFYPETEDSSKNLLSSNEN